MRFGEGGYVPPEARREAEASREAERTAETRKASGAGIESALSVIKEKYEDAKDVRERLPFHDTEHTKGVVDRAGAVLEAIRRAAPGAVSERDVEIGRLAAAFHDLVQDWEPNPMPDGEGQKVMRKRFASKNEAASAEAAVAFMRAMNEEARAQARPEPFTDGDMRIVSEAIDATVPGFDPEKATVIQPRLEDGSSLIARAVALADLGEAGMNTEGFIRGGDALFREENLDVLEALREPEKIPADQKERFRLRMLGWSKFQPKFAAGRKALLSKELAGIPTEARVEVEKLFSSFDGSIASATEVAAKREAMSFEQLAEDMGYVVWPFEAREQAPKSSVA